MGKEMRESRLLTFSGRGSISVYRGDPLSIIRPEQPFFLQPIKACASAQDLVVLDKQQKELH